MRGPRWTPTAREPGFVAGARAPTGGQRPRRPCRHRAAVAPRRGACRPGPHAHARGGTPPAVGCRASPTCPSLDIERPGRNGLSMFFPLIASANSNRSKDPMRRQVAPRRWPAVSAALTLCFARAFLPLIDLPGQVAPTPPSGHRRGRRLARAAAATRRTSASCRNSASTATCSSRWGTAPSWAASRPCATRCPSPSVSPRLTSTGPACTTPSGRSPTTRRSRSFWTGSIPATRWSGSTTTCPLPAPRGHALQA